MKFKINNLGELISALQKIAEAKGTDLAVRVSTGDISDEAQQVEFIHGIFDTCAVEIGPLPWEEVLK